jgi:MoaA/NifB/PqqE/SkfB family radical SAM enzyme
MKLFIDQWVKDLFFHAYAPLGWARSPNHVSLDITRRCNLRCRMCFYYGGEERETLHLDELSSREIISLVVKRLKGADYDITGGEPLVRPDLSEVLAAIRDQKAACYLTTNGTLMTAELARRVVDEDLLRGIHFSIHGLKETHEEITRVEKSFDRALRGMEMVLAERARRGTSLPAVTMACTIIGQNMKEVEGLVRLAQETGADWISFGHASFLPPETREAHQKALRDLGLDLVPDYDDLVQGPPEIPYREEDLETYIRAISRFRGSSERRWVRTSPEGYQGEDIRRHYADSNWKYRRGCTYPWRNLRIGPDGTVTPCVGYGIGNVREQDVTQMWNSPRFRKFRAALYRKMLFPGCVRCCKLK